jgi:hypothetical protein
MKVFNLLLAFSICFGTVSAQSKTKSKQDVTNIINAFSKAVDEKNAEALAPLLNENFRVVANRFPSEDKISILTKEIYLQLLKAGKIGGEKRTVEIKSIDIEAHIASAKIVFKSDKTTFITFQSFILNQHGNWQLIADMPFLKKTNEIKN